MQRTSNTHRKRNPPRQLLLWLCGVLAVALTMSRHWVICTHDGGEAHLEINHVQGDHPQGEHVHVGCDCHHHDGEDDGQREGGGQEGGGQEGGGQGPGDPHDTCSHIDLLVEVGPEQEPDSLELPQVLAFELPASSCGTADWHIATRQSLPPPATGPPRPREFLAARATQVLLI